MKGEAQILRCGPSRPAQMVRDGAPEVEAA